MDDGALQQAEPFAGGRLTIRRRSLFFFTAKHTMKLVDQAPPLLA
jgi:hypothetical protein